MSKAAKQSILVLIVLLLGIFSFATVTFLQKQELLQTKMALEKQLIDFQSREKQQITNNLQLQDKLKVMETTKADLEKRLSRVNVDIDSFDSTMKKVTQERDEWKQKVDEIKAERDKVVAKLDEKEKEGPKIVYKYVEKGSEGTQEASSGIEPSENEKKVPSAPPQGGDEAYWAQVLKEKAALEMELEKIKTNLTNNSVEVVELKKKNSDLQLELNQVINDKDAIGRDIKYANDLADSLALELARAKNDKKFLNDRLAKLNGDNTQLREQIKRLTSTKIALEKTVIRIQDEKKGVEKKLLETENVIQNRIDEIWQIKESLSQNIGPSKSQPGSQEVELPPIVVSSSPQDEETDHPKAKSTSKPTGFNGSVVSINEENNFVIIDVGEDAGIKLGETVNVYRGSDYIAGLQIIQTRKDICAADIKEQVAKIRVGDIVR